MLDWVDLCTIGAKLQILILALYCIYSLRKFRDHNPTLTLNYALLYLDISMIISHLFHDTIIRVAEKDVFSDLGFKIIQTIMFCRYFGQTYFLILLSLFLILACYWPNTYRTMKQPHTIGVMLIPALITIVHVTLFVWECDCMIFRVPEYVWDSNLSLDSPKMIYYLYSEGLKVLCLALLVVTDVALLIKLYRHGLYRGPKYLRTQTTDQQITSNLGNSNNGFSMMSNGITSEIVRRRPRLRIDARLALGFTYLCTAFVCSSVHYKLKNDMDPMLHKIFYHLVGILELSKCSMYILINLLNFFISSVFFSKSIDKFLLVYDVEDVGGVDVLFVLCAFFALFIDFGRAKNTRSTEADRKLQIDLLNDKAVFPRADLLNQRYVILIKPMVVKHVLTMPAFVDFLLYYSEKLNKEFKNASEFKQKRIIEEALDNTFDMLIKQYGRFKADDNIKSLEGLFKKQEQEKQNQTKQRRHPNEQHKKTSYPAKNTMEFKDYLLSQSFLDELLKETGKYLEERIKEQHAQQHRDKAAAGMANQEKNQR
ncbi:unnamed protein product, partial [Mesorhabditis belari]|uniref:Uncharacterized protein n=1 Tax=Mesorhabditis belari TaxID=2138241 RepID=A0AAF3ES43_9BILA